MGKINGTAENILLDIEVVDYIVEQGTAGIWTYEKKASGIVKCWGSSTHLGIANTKWNEGHFYFAVNAIDFPENLFVEKPDVWVTIEEDSGYFFCTKKTSTKTNTGALYAMSPTQFTVEKTVTFNIEAKGRWK